MRKKTFIITAIFLFASFVSRSQTTSIYEVARITVYGDASVQTEADAITCWLNIYDNSATYDYSIPYDAKKAK